MSKVRADGKHRLLYVCACVTLAVCDIYLKRHTASEGGTEVERRQKLAGCQVSAAIKCTRNPLSTSITLTGHTDNRHTNIFFLTVNCRLFVVFHVQRIQLVPVGKCASQNQYNSLQYCPLLSSRPPTYGCASQTAGEQKQYTTHLLPTLNLHHPLPQRATHPRKQSSTHPIRNSRTSKRPALVCKFALHLPLRPPCLLICSLQPPRPPRGLNLKGQWSGQTEDMSAMCSSSDG